MNFEDLKRISISNLILIILNDKKDDNLRKCAEFELKKRIRNVGWKYDDLLHFDDKVIKERGLDIDNYVISPKVNMQQLMETYFMYGNTMNSDANYLLFSEKHLYNTIDFKEPFFRKVCTKEMKNIDKKLNSIDTDIELTQLLISIKHRLEQRQQYMKQEIKLLCINDANDSLFDTDIIQNLYRLKFITKDSAKLNSQKRKLLQQVKNGYEVNYQTDTMCKALQRSRH